MPRSEPEIIHGSDLPERDCSVWSEVLKEGGRGDAVTVLYLSSHLIFSLVFKATVALALISLSGCCNKTFFFHHFLPNPAMHDLFTWNVTLQFSHFCWCFSRRLVGSQRSEWHLNRGLHWVMDHVIKVVIMMWAASLSVVTHVAPCQHIILRTIKKTVKPNTSEPNLQKAQEIVKFGQLQHLYWWAVVTSESMVCISGSVPTDTYQ